MIHNQRRLVVVTPLISGSFLSRVFSLLYTCEELRRVSDRESLPKLVYRAIPNNIDKVLYSRKDRLEFIEQILSQMMMEEVD